MQSLRFSRVSYDLDASGVRVVSRGSGGAKEGTRTRISRQDFPHACHGPVYGIPWVLEDAQVEEVRADVVDQRVCGFGRGVGEPAEADTGGDLGVAHFIAEEEGIRK